jgi:hypothetical protein
MLAVSQVSMNTTDKNRNRVGFGMNVSDELAQNIKESRNVQAINIIVDAKLDPRKNISLDLGDRNGLKISATNGYNVTIHCRSIAEHLCEKGLEDIYKDVIAYSAKKKAETQKSEELEKALKRFDAAFPA